MGTEYEPKMGTDYEPKMGTKYEPKMGTQMCSFLAFFVHLPRPKLDPTCMLEVCTQTMPPL